MTKPILGAQLYTVREYTKTLPEIERTLQRIKAVGYTAVQLSALGPVDPRELAKRLDDSGLTVAATHVSWERCLKDPDRLIEEHQMWRCRHMAIGGLPDSYYNAEGVRRFIDEVTPLAEKLARLGMDFSYHNHNHELARCNGEVWLEKLYREAPPEVLKAELDTYWIQAGGGDPAAWVRRCTGREPLLHLKDMAITPQREIRMAEIGEGNLNWPAILAEAEKGGVEYLLVEQDHCYGRDPFDSLALSYRNLRAMGYR